MLKKHEDKVICIITMLLGAIIFILVYGINVLNPLYDDWLMSRTDLAQHYLGWCFYRKGSWMFPIGLTDNLAYPTCTSVIFTDSIPMFAVLFKLFSPILPDTFQYFGLWGIMSFMLQGFFAAKILQKLSVSKVQTLFGSVIFVLSPTVIERMFRHTALGGQWIILAAIYMFVRHKETYRRILISSVWWGGLGALVAAIHLYYFPMCGMFLGGYIVCSFLKERRIRLSFLIPGIAFMSGILISTFLLGGFSSQAASEADGLGYYSFNLNGFFNEKGYSRIFDVLPTYTDGQYEGFAYLGLGIFLLLFIALIYVGIYFVKGRGKKPGDFWMYAAVYFLMSAGLILFAASPQVSFNDKLLFEYPYSSTLYHYWSIFRSTGRIVWPVCYLIYIGVIICNDKLWKNYVKKEYIASVVIVICVCAQIFDLSDKLGEQKGEFDKVQYETILRSEVWDRLAGVESLEHVVWVSDSFDNSEILHIARYANDNNWTMNNFYFARGINVRENTEESMQNLSDNCVYIFSKEEAADYDLYLYEADEYIVGTTFPLE